MMVPGSHKSSVVSSNMHQAVCGRSHTIVLVVFAKPRAARSPPEYKLNANVCLKFHTASLLSCAHRILVKCTTRAAFVFPVGLSAGFCMSTPMGSVRYVLRHFVRNVSTKLSDLREYAFSIN